MSIYKKYTDYIHTFIDSDIEEWYFKSNPNYVYMLEHVSGQQGSDYSNEIQTRFNLFYNQNKNYLIELCNINDLYGKTNKITYTNFTTCSPTNLRYILHSLLILSYINECKLNNIDNMDNIDIIEIGGGYGGLCFYVNKLAKLFNITINTYTIFDLQEPLLLQKKYLEKLNVNTMTTINYYDVNNINHIQNLKLNSFLISTYAFSEIPLELQKEYTNKVLNVYVSHGFIAWNNIDVYNFIENKNITSEREFPLTGNKNYYVKFRPL